MSIRLDLRIEPGKRLLRGRDHMWSVIRAVGVGGTFTVGDIDGASNEKHRPSVRDFIKRLVRAGYAEEAGTRPRSGTPAKVYRLLKAPGTLPPINRDGSIGTQGRANRAMWNVMRGPLLRDGFTAEDLALYASTDDVPVSRLTALTYCRHIDRAGYLAIVDAGGPNRPRVWRLKPSMNTGPKPPMILRARLVYDDNRGAIMGETVAEEVPS